MNIKDFRYVIAVVDSGSYSKAAESLFISQPSLSSYIRNLEKQLDIRFFENGTRNLTPEGQIYVEYARQIAALDDALMEKMDQLHRSKGNQLKIGMTNGRSEQFLEWIYDCIARTTPQITVDICIDISENLIRKTASGELDLILINQYPDMSGLHFETIYTDPMLIALHKDHPALKTAYSVPGDKYRHLSPSALYDLSYIVFPEGRSLRSALDTFFQAANRKPKIVQEITNIRSGCKLVSRQIGALPLFDIPTETDVLGTDCECFLIDTDLLKINYVMAWDKNRPLSSEQKKMFRKISSVIQDHR